MGPSVERGIPPAGAAMDGQEDPARLRRRGNLASLRAFDGAHRMPKRTLCTLTALLLLAAPALAQAVDKTRVWYPHVGVGYAASSGIVDDLFTAGPSISGGMGYEPRRVKVVGAWFGADYNGYAVSQRELDDLGVANGDLRVWDVAGGLQLATHGKVGFFATLGAGWYWRQVDLLNPTQPETAIACNPWWDFCVGVGVVATQNVVGSSTTNGIGYNAGIGLSFRLPSGSEIYLAAKYHYVPADVEAIEMIPFLIGYRWGS